MNLFRCDLIEAMGTTTSQERAAQELGIEPKHLRVRLAAEGLRALTTPAGVRVVIDSHPVRERTP